MAEVGMECMTPFVTLDTHAHYQKEFPEKRIILAYHNGMSHDICGFWILPKKTWKKYKANKICLSFNNVHDDERDLTGKPISTIRVENCPTPRWGFKNMKEFKAFMKNVEKEIEKMEITP